MQSCRLSKVPTLISSKVLLPLGHPGPASEASSKADSFSPEFNLQAQEKNSSPVGTLLPPSFAS